MKKINFDKLDERNDYTITDFIRIGGAEMELIKRTDGRYMIKDSNGTIISKKEKRILERPVEKPVNKKKKKVADKDDIKKETSTII